MEDDLASDAKEAVKRPLFFPREVKAGKKKDAPLPTHVVLLRVPGPAGGDRVAARVRATEKEIVGALLDIRLPGTMLALAGDASSWYATYDDASFDDRSAPIVRRQRGNCIMTLSSLATPAARLNPALFFAPMPLDALVDNIVPGKTPPSTVLFSASLLVQLLRHDAYPYTGEPAMDAHAALLVWMQQLDFGMEQYVADGTADGIQQCTNAVLACCLLQMRAAASHLVDPVRFSSEALDFVAVLKSSRAVEMLNDGGLASDDRVYAFRGDEAIFTLMRLEGGAPIWRLHAASVLNQPVDTVLCHTLFKLILLRVTAPYHVVLQQLDRDARDANVQERVRRAYEARLDTGLGVFMDALTARFAALVVAMRDGVHQTRALLRRYGVNDADAEDVEAWMQRRAILRNAMLNVQRLYEQMHTLRDYYRSVRACRTVIETTSPFKASDLRAAIQQWSSQTVPPSGALAWQVELASEARVGRDAKDAAILDFIRETMRPDHITFLLDTDFDGFLSIL